MAQSLAIPRVIPNNWKRLDLIVNKIKFSLGSASSPIHAGLTITGLTASTLIGANASKALESVTVGTGLDYTRPTLSLSHLGIEALTDPGADKIMFWDDNTSACAWLVPNTLISITGTNLDVDNDLHNFSWTNVDATDLKVGSVTQAFDVVLDDISALAVVADNEFIVGTGAGVYAHESGATVRTSLGLAIGTDVQAHGDVLDDLNTLGIVGADSEFLVGTGTGALAWENAATARTSLGIVIGTDVQAYHANLTSLAGLTYASASFVKMTGTDTFALRTIGETADDLEGTIDHNQLANYDANKHVDHTGVTLTAGTGLTGGGDISSSRSFAVDGLLEDLDTLGPSASDGQFIVATGAGAFAYEATTTVRTSLGLGTGDSPQFTGIELGHASDTTITRASAGNLNIEGNLVYRAGGTDVPIGDGGTGQSTAQAAIDTLSAVSGATNEHVLTKDTASGNAIWKVAAGGNGASTWIALTDTDPANYTGQAGNTVVVNAGEDGLEFGAAPGGAFTSKCSVYLSSDTAIAHNTWTKVLFNVENYDTDGEYDNVTNYRFQPSANGYYHVDASAVLLSCPDGKYFAIAILKTGTYQLTAGEGPGWLANPALSISRDFYLTTNDYIEIWVYHNVGANRSIQGLIYRTGMTVHRFA